MKHPFLLACLLPLLLHSSSSVSAKSTQEYLTEGNTYLTAGQYNDAVISFDAAISQDPENYQTYYKRATAYLSLGRTSAALDDFTTILTLRPNFNLALIQRARTYTKGGDFQLAQVDLESFLKAQPKNKEAAELLASVKVAEKAAQDAQSALKDKDYDQCIQHVSTAAPIAPQYTLLRKVRAECYLAKGDIEAAVGDLTRAAHLSPSEPALLLRLSKLNYFSLYEAQHALAQVKQCLHYDPEQKACKALFRLIKKMEKELNSVLADMGKKKIQTALNRLIGTSSKQGLVSEIEKEEKDIENDLNLKEQPRRLALKAYETACSIYGQQEKEPAKIDKWCSATLALNGDHVEALIARGKMYLEKREFEAAVADLEKANELSGGQNNQVRQLLQKSQQFIRQSKLRDYYKILDVARDADTRDIKKAYRKLAHEWHPDKYSGDLTKEQAESKMAEINQAYEVLSNAEMRQQFDSGSDPFDAESQQGSHGFHGQNPFAHFQGGFPFQGGFGGGSQHFEFNMNF
ncbi:hypothetical protein BDF14DRAFT_1752341 [Spinellus fusiger]|nr:hypothetical protein BDF14DRAFT_1752341 [Spinellus fusiger]